MSLINKQVKPVEFLDLTALHAPIRAELEACWTEALDTSAFIGGAIVDSFERVWADYCGVDHCVGVANGTDALELVLAGLGIGPGDEILVPANTFVATAEAVVTVGATPVFVDVDPETLLVTAEGLTERITPHTKAAMIVHLYGQIPDMDAIGALASSFNFHIIEDAAQAHGATFGGKKAGSFGTAATFSFYPGKNLGAIGDGGAVVTNDSNLAAEVRTLANHGRGNHLLHTHRGRNSRLDCVQAKALEIKLSHLDRWNDHRRAIHRVYVESFVDTPVVTTQTLEHSVPVHHLEVVRVDDRDRIREALGEVGIKSGIHYALPCHKHPAFAEFDVRRLPVAEAAADQQFSLPMHPTLEIDQAHQVASTLLELM